MTLYKNPTSELPSAYQLWIGYNNVNYNFIGDIYYLFFLTLPACIAYSDTFLEDRKCNAFNLVITRCDRKLYILSKGIVVFFSGFIVIFLPLFIHQLLCLVVMPLYSPSEVIAGNPVYDKYYLTKIYFKQIHTLNPYLHNMLYIFLDGLFGGVIAFFSYSISFLKNINRYVVIILPTVLFFIQNFLAAVFGNANYSLSYYLSVTTSIKDLNYIAYWISLAVLIIVGLCIIILSNKLNKDAI